MISEARLNANRANALKSTGPKTEEGKAISRLNSTTHGLTGAGVALASYDPDLVAQRVAAWSEMRRPVTSRERWLVEQIALATIRIDQCRLEEDCLRTQTAHRAAVCWFEERRVDAEVLAGKIARNPGLVVAKLRGTLYGTGWLRERWESLEAAAMQGVWDEKQRALALDMLGVSIEFRESSKRLLGGGPDGESQAMIARREIERIDASFENGLAYVDEREQKMAEEGVSLSVSAPARLLRRYESEAWKRYRWADQELKAGRPCEISRPRNEPKPRPEPAISEPIEDACDEEIGDEAEEIGVDAGRAEVRKQVSPHKVHRNRKARRAIQARERRRTL